MIEIMTENFSREEALQTISEKIPTRDSPNYDSVGKRFVKLLKIPGDTTYWVYGANKLGKMGYEPAKGDLTDLLRAESKMYSDSVRRRLHGVNGARAEAALALGKIGGEGVADELRRVIYNPDSTETPCILEASIFGLGLSEGEGAVDEIVELLKSETFFVRADAVKALERIGSPRSYEAIEVLLGDEVKSVRDCARKALDLIGGKI